MIVPLRRAVVADKAGRAGGTGHINRGTVTGQDTIVLIAVVLLAVCAGRCKVQKHLAEHGGRDLTAALRHGGGGSVNPGAVQLLRQRPTLGGDQELDKFLGRQLLAAGCVGHALAAGDSALQSTLEHVSDR